MPFTEAPGFRMYYEIHGAGFPLLMINGLGGDHMEWEHQMPDFAPRLRVITFDNRGAGDSASPPGPYTTAAMADDAAALLAYLRVERAHVLGVSMGAMIAQEVALRHPDRVSRLVLGCATPGGAGTLRPSPEALASFVRSESGDREEEIRRSLPFLYSERFREEHPGEIDAFVRRRLERPFDAAGHAAQLAAAIGHDAWDRLPLIDAPTLVITGAGDLLVPPENSRRIAERIPGATLVVLPDAPHRLFAEASAAFNRAALAFLT